MINDGYGVMFWLLALATVIQVAELWMLHRADFEEAQGFSFVRLVLLITFLIASFVCWINRDRTLVDLDATETNIISQYRAEQAVIKAQQELQKLKQKGDNGGHDQNRDGQRLLP